MAKGVADSYATLRVAEQRGCTVEHTYAIDLSQYTIVKRGKGNDQTNRY